MGISITEACTDFFYLHTNEMLNAFNNHHGLHQNLQQQETLKRSLMASILDIGRSHNNVVDNKKIPALNINTRDIHNIITDPTANIKQYITKKIFVAIKKIDYNSLKKEDFIQKINKIIEDNINKATKLLGNYSFYESLSEKYKNNVSKILKINNDQKEILDNLKTEILNFFQDSINDLNKVIHNDDNNRKNMVKLLKDHYISHGIKNHNISKFLAFFLNQGYIIYACSSFLLFMTADTCESDNNQLSADPNDGNSHFSELNILNDQSCNLIHHFYLCSKSNKNEVLYQIHHKVCLNINSNEDGKITITYLWHKSDTTSLEKAIQQINNELIDIKKHVNVAKQKNFFIKPILTTAVVLEILLLVLLCFLIYKYEKGVNILEYRAGIITTSVFIVMLVLTLPYVAMMLYTNHCNIRKANVKLQQLMDYKNSFQQVNEKCKMFDELDSVDASEEFLNLLKNSTEDLRSRPISNNSIDDYDKPNPITRFTDMIEENTLSINSHLSPNKT